MVGSTMTLKDGLLLRCRVRSRDLSDLSEVAVAEAEKSKGDRFVMHMRLFAVHARRSGVWGRF